MFDLISEIRQTLRSNRLRTFLTGISVAWGVFMLILLLGVARGVTNSFQQDMGGDRSNKIQIWGGRTSMPYRGYPDGRSIQLRASDPEVIARSNRGNIADVYPSTGSDTAVVTGPRDSKTSLSAVYPHAVNPMLEDMVGGRKLNQRDIDEERRSMVLCRRHAELLFGSADSAVGRTVSAMGLAWTVVGIYDHPWRDDSYIPYTTYKALTGNDNELENINIAVRDISDQAGADALERDVRHSLALAHEFHPDDDSAVWVWNSLSDYFATNNAMRILTLAVWIIGLFSLLTGIVGVSNIMFVSVRERTHEIGIRRAIGARPRSILTQILAEGVAITALFGYAGVFAGMMVLQIVDSLVGDMEGFSNPTVDISIAIEITATLIVAGALAGLFPALKALKIKPVEALRDE